MRRATALLLYALSACGDAAAATPAEQWRVAEQLFREQDLGAYDAWMALDPASTEGREARARLREADAHYREGMRRLGAGEEGAREELVRGVRTAPMDPALYLPLARACREADLLPRAAEYYLKFLAVRPDDPDAPIARRELAELDPELAGVFDPRLPRATGDDAPAGPSVVATAIVSGLFGAALAGLVGLVVVSIRRRGVPLERLAARAPELHPAIAYLVSSLRHELLKHRIGAVGDAVQALERGDASVEQLAFVKSRLFGGEPLVEAWRGHVAAFGRALGYQLDLGRDRAFRRAGSALARIAKLEPRIARGDRTAGRPLAQAWGTLRALDAELAALVKSLVRTRIDVALLEAIVAEVRSEYAPGRVEVDELAVTGPAASDDVEVEVFRVDLVLILKNVVRNAILAVGRAEPPRRVAVSALVELEPTGVEVVFIRVDDTSGEALTTEAIYDRRVDRGLGLVTAALTRYDGAIEVEAPREGYAKAVSVRLFRAQGELEEPAS